MSIVPASLTAAFLTACALALLFIALRRHIRDRDAVVATTVLGFCSPVWAISADSMWPHTITILGIAGMVWGASRDRWWWVGVFGGITLWGRMHAAIIVAVLGLGVAVSRRDGRLPIRIGLPSAGLLVACCGWIRWMYGSWSPLGAYDGATVNANAAQYRFSIVNQLGMWISPDRGILVWTPLAVLLLPALIRSWTSLPDWSKLLLLGGLGYTVLNSALNTFTGGEFFYGYRYGLEMLACATPALALSARRVGRLARPWLGPVAAIQFIAFMLGATGVAATLPQGEAWERNAFVSELSRLGPPGWITAALAGLMGALAVRLVADREPGVGRSSSDAW